MIPLGYLYKLVADRPEWLTAANVADVYSLSGCVSKPFADYIDYWKHNGYWLFNSPREITELANAASISLEGLKLFYYEAYELQFDEDEKVWEAFEPWSATEVLAIAYQPCLSASFSPSTFCPSASMTRCAVLMSSSENPSASRSARG